MVSSVPMKPEIFRSSSLWMVCVPQMNRTLASPNPYLAIPSCAASMRSGWLARPR